MIFTFFPDGGLHCISAGMNWGPTDKTSLLYHTFSYEQEFKNKYKYFIDRLQTRKDEWNKIVENKPSYINFLKDNIYNENSTS